MKYNYKKLLELYPEAQTFLDLGCGQGFISLYAAARGLTVEALDIVEQTPAPLQDVPSVTYTVADLNEWRPEKQYDIIVAHHSIQFLQREHALREFLPSLCKSLTPGGLFEISTFLPEETLQVPTKYALEEVLSALDPYVEILEQKTVSYEGMHRKLGMHTFHEIYILARKPAAEK
jgi:trans-aconitate methyltransferase